MRKKINFDCLLQPCGGYIPQAAQLEVLNWMLRTGKDPKYQCGRGRFGIDKLVFGYSANDHDSRTPLMGSDRRRMFFLNAIHDYCDGTYQAHSASEWRKDMGIGIGKSKFFDFPDGTWDDAHVSIDFAVHLPGKKLKKQYFHPDLLKRLDPYIQYAKFYTLGEGLVFGLEFTFTSCQGSGWWADPIQQQPGESIPAFMGRVMEDLREKLEDKI
jgi:hypothetical protein